MSVVRISAQYDQSELISVRCAIRWTFPFEIAVLNGHEYQRWAWQTSVMPISGTHASAHRHRPGRQAAEWRSSVNITCVWNTMLLKRTLMRRVRNNFKVGSRVQVYVRPDDVARKLDGQIGIIRQQFKRKVYDVELESGVLVYLHGSKIRPVPYQFSIDMDVEIIGKNHNQDKTEKYYGRKGQVTRLEKYQGCNYIWVQLYGTQKEKKKPRIGIVNCEDGTAKKMMVVSSDDESEHCFFLSFFQDSLEFENIHV